VKVITWHPLAPPAVTASLLCTCLSLLEPVLQVCCCLLMSAKARQCPVLGCCTYSNRWKHKAYRLRDVAVFTLQLDSSIDTLRSNKICNACYNRHRDHRMPLDGRTRVVPTAQASGAGMNAPLSTAQASSSSSSSHPSFLLVIVFVFAPVCSGWCRYGRLTLLAVRLHCSTFRRCRGATRADEGQASASALAAAVNQ
jgi:hypothetical protein